RDAAARDAEAPVDPSELAVADEDLEREVDLDAADAVLADLRAELGIDAPGPGDPGDGAQEGRAEDAADPRPAAAEPEGGAAARAAGAPVGPSRLPVADEDLGREGDLDAADAVLADLRAELGIDAPGPGDPGDGAQEGRAEDAADPRPAAAEPEGGAAAEAG